MSVSEAPELLNRLRARLDYRKCGQLETVRAPAIECRRTSPQLYAVLTTSVSLIPGLGSKHIGPKRQQGQFGVERERREPRTQWQRRSGSSVRSRTVRCCLGGLSAARCCFSKKTRRNTASAALMAKCYCRRQRIFSWLLKRSS